MILEALGLASLAASAWSDAERRRVASLVAMKHWSKLYERIGPHRFVQVVEQLAPVPAGHPPSEHWRGAHDFLSEKYLEAAKEHFEEDSDIEVPDSSTVMIDPDYAMIMVDIWISDDQVIQLDAPDKVVAAQKLYGKHPLLSVDNDAYVADDITGGWVEATLTLPVDRLEGP
jgi:hypothetical protein